MEAAEDKHALADAEDRNDYLGQKIAWRAQSSPMDLPACQRLRSDRNGRR